MAFHLVARAASVSLKDNRWMPGVCLHFDPALVALHTISQEDYACDTVFLVSGMHKIEQFF
jgi:hypothetical protein